MRVSILLLLIATNFVFGNKSYSQNAELTLEFQNIAIKKVLDKIENNSEFYFLYSNKLIDVNQKVSIAVQNQKIKTILDKMFADSEIAYMVMDRQIVLSTRDNLLSSAKKVQQNEVTGTVTDAKTGDPLPGVNITVQGVSTGTVTDANGEYSIAVEDPEEDKLVFSFVGYKDKTVTVNEREEINVSLKQSATEIEEVVAIGYGTQQRENLTGAVSSVEVEGEVASSRSITNTSELIDGAASGMIITENTGTPSNDDATIRIRGTGSLNASSSPLVVIDGQVGSLNDVNPSDIASVSVLKDAASAAIYGSRASNGVILITTKSGGNTDGEISLNYSGNVGFSNPTRLHEHVDNTATHMELVNRMRENSGLTKLYSQDKISEWRNASDPVLYPNTNWWDAIIQTNTTQKHNLSARGGTETVNFYTSLGYNEENGIIKNSGYKEYNFRANLEYKVNDWLKLRSKVTGLFGDSEPLSASDIFTYWDATTPGLLPKHPDGRYGGAMTGGAEQQANNIVRTIETNVGEDKTQNYTGKLMATLNPIEGLNIKASYFIDIYNNHSWSSQEPTNTYDFQNNVIMKRGAVNPRITLYNSTSKNQRRVIDLYADYEQSIGRHNFKALGGFNQEYFKNQWFSADKNDLYSLEIPVLDAATSEPHASGSTYDYAIRSYFGRLNYNFAERFLLEANVRYDGSSRFHPDQRWGVFPSFSAGWRVSEENFWSPLEDHITYLKLRASYGRLGNAGIGNYEWQSVYNSANYSFNGQTAEGLAPNSIANKDITWETTDVLDIGLDIELYENISMTVDYYNKYTHGILARTPIPLVNGGLAAPRENSAEVRNKGMETELSYNNRFGDFSLSASINGAYNKNEIVKYKGDYLEPHGAGVWTEGEPIGKYWVREVDHIVQDDQEIEKMVNNGWEFGPATPGAGDFLYEENTGDKKINKEDRVLKGNPIPKFNFGGSLQLRYKGLDLSASFSGVAGWDKYFYDNFFSLEPRTDGYLYPEKFLNSWTPENQSTEVPKLYTNDARNNQQSDYYLHDASYFRINSLQIGYDIMSSNLLSINGIQKLRVYVNFENYFTFTSYPGLDPENSSNKTYPLMKTVSFGLNMNL